MKIFIEEENCIGCGLCDNLCPAIFKLNGGLAKVVKEEIKKEDDCGCDIEEVVENCPCNAIKIK